MFVNLPNTEKHIFFAINVDVDTLYLLEKLLIMININQFGMLKVPKSSIIYPGQ